MKKNMSVIYRLLCVRHGETDANKEMRIQGHLDISLNAAGEAQAEQAGIALKSTKFSRVYASDLKRASRTCELIIEKNDFPVKEMKKERRIRERDFGNIEGMLFLDVLELVKVAGTSFSNYNPPGAETVGDVQTRLVDFFKDLCQSVYDHSKNNGTTIEEVEGKELKDLEPTETILMVSHGAALKQLFVHFARTLACEGLPENEEVMKIAPNTGISEFLIKYSPRKYKLHCVRFYDAAHLKDWKIDVPPI